MSDRKIGRVISVDSFRVIVELDDEIKGSYKNGYYDLYEVAKINSYIIIPVADEQIVALVTRVKINDETDIETSTGVVSLPKSKRYIVATMLGTITGSKNNKEYIQGVYNFPVLDNEVWYVVEQDLRMIFDYRTVDDKEAIDFKNDYFLSIGTSPVFKDFEVKINPDKFFSKHAAVLGNTGSGKSCTVSSIIQSIFFNKYKYEDSEGETKVRAISNAHFIVFDTNGEYKKAFDFGDDEIRKRINAFTIENEGLKVPYWFMNYDDFDYLFKPSEGTQAPILKRAIELAKNEKVATKNNKLPQITINLLYELKNLSLDTSKHKEFRELLYREFETIAKMDFLKSIFKDSNDRNDYVVKVGEGKFTRFMDSKISLDASFKDKLANLISNELNMIVKDQQKDKVEEERNIDIPQYFDFKSLIGKYIDEAIKEQDENNSRLNEFLSALRLRLSSFCSDERFSKPFMINKCDNYDGLLSEFLEYIFGVPQNNDEDRSVFKQYKDSFSKETSNKYLKEENSQITIIDMSLLPSEVLENVTGLIGRMILEFLSRIDKIKECNRGNYPTVIVLEEAQNYIPEYDRNSDRISISKRVFERIAREGRKYGLSLLISSQRPSELSKTILSQCNTFIVHRIQNPDDQKYIRQLVSSANEDILSQLPVLPQQHAIIMGDAVRSPIQVKLRDAKPTPNSDNPEYFGKWISDVESDKLNKEVINKVVEEWIK